MSDMRKEVVLECSGRRFVLDKPLMKHNRSVEKIVRFFGEQRSELGGIVGKLQDAGIEIKDKIDIPDGLLTEDEIKKIESMNANGSVMVILPDLLFATLREAPWESDFKKINIMSIDENVEMDEGLELIQYAIPIIEGVMIKNEKKTEN